MSNGVPSQASVVVVGGGIMGCSTLYHLAKSGVSDAILLERNQLTSGTTWHSAAQVRALRSSQNLTNLIRYSIDLYKHLEQETGQSTGWIGKGSLSIATTPDRLIHIRRQEALAHLFGVAAKPISVGEAKEIWPLMNVDDVIGAVWSPDDGRVSPSDLCAALVKGARSKGARVFEGTGVTGILTRGGRIAGLETTRGQVRTDAVVLCTGLWSRDAAAMAGANTPLWPCEHFYLLTKPIEGLAGNVPTLSDHDSHLYMRDDSGGLLVGCFEPMGKPISPEQLGDDFAFQLLPEDWDHFEPMIKNALHRLPALETAEVKMLLNGPECFTPDGSFILGEAAETPGLFLGCGMNSIGIAIGGGAGMALAHCVVDGHLPMDLHEVDPARFADCWNDVKVLSARAPEVLGRHYEIAYPYRQMSTSRNLRPTPLDRRWRREQPHFGEFYGWERPLYFGKTEEPKLTFGKPPWFENVRTEVMRAHRHAALFDQSPLGKIRVSGPDAERFLDRVCANNMARPPGHAIYTSMLNPRGGIESDLTAIRLDDETYCLYVGTMSVRRDMAWLRRNLTSGERVDLADETEDYSVIGLMGPSAGEIAVAAGGADLVDLKYFRHGIAEIAGVKVRGVRMSYVGEAGWEITCPTVKAEALYEALFAAGARPAGLLAQTSMRIEKRFLAYGHDMNTDTTVFDAGIDFAVAWERPFIGREALLDLKDKPRRWATVTILFDNQDAWPHGNEPVYVGNEIVGATTSAAYGFRCNRPVAIAQVKPAAVGVSVEVDVAGYRVSGTTFQKAAFDSDGKRVRGGIIVGM